MNILEANLLMGFIIHTICSAEETTTFVSVIASTTINVTDSTVTNSAMNNTMNINLTRITQPTKNMVFMTKNTEMPTKKTELTAKKEMSVKNLSKSVDFFPSPQLETYIEYNKYPVVPAHPEAKQYYSQHSYIPPAKKQAEDKKGVAIIKNDKKESKSFLGQIDITTGKSVLAAEEKQFFPSSYEKPTRTDYSNYNYYERYNYPGPSIPANTLYPSVPSLDWHNKANFPAKSAAIPLAEHPYPFVKDVMSSVIYPKSMIHEMAKMSPWKRAAKIFATILPIGLLISALTPNILTIGPVNSTNTLSCRKLAGRAEELGVDKVTIEKWAKPGCESRLLCETAIREDKFDIEVVKQLFWSFVSQNAEESETPAQLEAVSNAIKEKRCDKISCRRVEEKSLREDKNKS